MPKVIIKDNASYVVIAITSNQGGTDYQESLKLYSTKVFVSLFLFRDVVKSPWILSETCKKALLSQSLFYLEYEVIFSPWLLEA